MQDYSTTVEYQGTLIAVIPIGYVQRTTWESTIAFKGVEGQTINLKNLGNTEQDYIICYLTIYK